MYGNMLSTASTLALVTCLSTPAAAFWRMPCPGRLALERIDPIISPGMVSGHVHTVSGGSGFGFSTSYEQQIESACSSCPIKADLSAYWTPKLYWMNEDATEFQPVLQSGEGAGSTGGMTVYYEQRPSTDNGRVMAFPEGFRMVAGDPFIRNATGLNAAPGNAVQFVCLNYQDGSSQSLDIPNKQCPDGLRAQVYFPSCWDGVHLEAPDHKSHMAYPIGDNTYDNGYCPDSHPVRLISIFFEIIYSIDQFADQWWSPDQHPFVFAQGDRTGYGFHGDFVNGWNTTVLQAAADNCNAESGTLQDCPYFNAPGALFTDDECHACRLPPSVDENITTDLTALPGCNTPTDGPAYAPPQSCAFTPISAPQQPFTDMIPSKNYAYAGCATDNVSSRTFNGAVKFTNDMTIELCIDFCQQAGYSLAGLEYASQCYCDNSYSDPSREPQPNILGNCLMSCASDASQICGGGNALSVYASCAGQAGCENVEFVVNGTQPAGSSKVRRHARDLF